MMPQRLLLWAASSIGILVILILSFFGPGKSRSLWYTPDQQADHFMRDQDFVGAAKLYTAPERQGVAFYRAGDFKSAATAFSHVATANSVYNQANSLVMLGKYEDAVKAYDRALNLRPHWKDAEENRQVAIIRRDRLKTTGGDDIGGQIAPDQIVYEKGATKSADSVQVNDGPRLNDAELQALWLRRVQTKPADFLRAKFAYEAAQNAHGESR